MAQTFSRRPGTTAAVLRSGNKRPSAAKGDKPELWSSLLDNAAPQKRRRNSSNPYLRTRTAGEDLQTAIEGNRR
ncbi:hypothetical protein LTR28_001493 [Elasticomyces elasticus]|nr:hypothetical protein LTR28_001493 [Elasticomyces elasticus]